MTLADLGSSIHGLTGHWPVLDTLMRVCADYLFYGVAVLLVALWLHRAGLRAGLGFAVGAVLALGIGAVLGSLWPEQRPFVADHFAPLIAHGADGSFPSDHLLVIGALTGACWGRARWLAVLTLALGVVVAVGRVYVGVHYPIDVVAGFAIGAVCGLGGWFAILPVLPLLDRLDQYRSVRPIVFGRGEFDEKPRTDRGHRVGTAEQQASFGLTKTRRIAPDRWWIGSLIPLLCLPLVEVSAYRRLLVVLLACAAVPVLLHLVHVLRHRLGRWGTRVSWGVALMMTTAGLVFAPVRGARPGFWPTLAVVVVVVSAVAAGFGGRPEADQRSAPGSG